MQAQFSVVQNILITLISGFIMTSFKKYTYPKSMLSTFLNILIFFYHCHKLLNIYNPIISMPLVTLSRKENGINHTHIACCRHSTSFPEKLLHCRWSSTTCSSSNNTSTNAHAFHFLLSLSLSLTLHSLSADSAEAGAPLSRTGRDTTTTTSISRRAANEPAEKLFSPRCFGGYSLPLPFLRRRIPWLVCFLC